MRSIDIRTPEGLVGGHRFSPEQSTRAAYSKVETELEQLLAEMGIS